MICSDAYIMWVLLFAGQPSGLCYSDHVNCAIAAMAVNQADASHRATCLEQAENLPEWMRKMIRHGHAK